MEITQKKERIKFAPKTFVIPPHKTVSTKVIKTKKYMDILTSFTYRGGKKSHQIFISACMPKRRNCHLVKVLQTRENEELVSYYDVDFTYPKGIADYFGGFLPPQIIIKIKNNSHEAVKIKMELTGVYLTIIK